MMKRSARVLAALLLAALIPAAACAVVPVAGGAQSPEPLPPITPTPIASATPAPVADPTPTPTPAPLCFSMWIPYWDYAAAVGEMPFCSAQTEAMIGFGAIFDNADRVLVMPQMRAASGVLSELCADSRAVYLSFVNDIELSYGRYSNKDVRLLGRLLKSEAAMDAHIADVLATAAAYGVDGVEIDYENVEDDETLFAPFVRFIEKLFAQTESLGLKLRVVLGWNYARLTSFPEGPEYAVMCYNLYGTHSGPGPKADKDFLELCYSINQSLPGRVVMAFATGGFDWAAGGGIAAVTERAAVRLRESPETDPASVARDEASRCVRFTYVKNGVSHEVWYADAETLLYWRQLGVEQGYRDFALFRLGGNEAATLRAFTAPDG